MLEKLSDAEAWLHIIRTIFELYFGKTSLPALVCDLRRRFVTVWQRRRLPHRGVVPLQRDKSGSASAKRLLTRLNSSTGCSRTQWELWICGYQGDRSIWPTVFINWQVMTREEQKVREDWRREGCAFSSEPVHVLPVLVWIFLWLHWLPPTATLGWLEALNCCPGC